MTSNDNTGVIIVDHGSKRAESNEMLLQVVALFEQRTDYTIVEAADMHAACEFAKQTMKLAGSGQIEVREFANVGEDE